MISSWFWSSSDPGHQGELWTCSASHTHTDTQSHRHTTTQTHNHTIAHTHTQFLSHTLQEKRLFLHFFFSHISTLLPSSTPPPLSPPSSLSPPLSPPPSPSLSPPPLLRDSVHSDSSSLFVCSLLWFVTGAYLHTAALLYYYSYYFIIIIHLLLLFLYYSQFSFTYWDRYCLTFNLNSF